jgi:cytochrome P450
LAHAQIDASAPPLPHALLRNELTFHLGASTETLAVAEGWTLYLLSRQPDVLERVRSEFTRALTASTPAGEQVAVLTYTRQVIQEALRCYPPVFAIVRDCVQSTDLLGHPVRKGEVLFISVYAMHRNPRLWERPLEFRPERFQADRTTTINKYQYLPFGAGKHVCIGQHLAIPLMVLTLAEFAHRFDWTFADADIRPVARPSLKPSGAFRATLTRRS